MSTNSCSSKGQKSATLTLNGKSDVQDKYAVDYILCSVLLWAQKIFVCMCMCQGAGGADLSVWAAYGRAEGAGGTDATGAAQL